MKIDNRLLLPFVMPLVVWLWARLFFWITGAGWNTDAGAGISLIVGVFAGGLSAVILFVEDKPLGHITIGRAKE